jgi:hypothetical protein
MLHTYLLVGGRNAWQHPVHHDAVCELEDELINNSLNTLSILANCSAYSTKIKANLVCVTFTAPRGHDGEKLSSLIRETAVLLGVSQL